MRCDVAVIGGGYGGTLVAKALDREADVVLIDPRDAFVNAAGMLRALTRPDWAPHVFFPYRLLLERGRFVRDRAASVSANGVTLVSGDHIAADYVVLATGSGYSYPGKPSADTTADALADLRATHAELHSAGRVLIVGAGPVGLELCGEIREVWPDKRITVVERGDTLLPGFLPALQADLRRQLEALGVELRLGTRLASLPESPAGIAEPIVATTTTGEAIEADIWFRAFGIRLHTDYLRDGNLVEPTEHGAVPVTPTLHVRGHQNVYALGDIVDLPDPKMASYAQTHAQTVIDNIRAQRSGRTPGRRHALATERRILVPLGTKGGVGQLPGPDGVAELPTDVVIERKGADLFTARFAARFDVDR